MKKFLLAVVTVAFMASCGDEVSNDYAKAVVAACVETVEAINVAENKKDLRKAKEDHYKALRNASKENKKAENEMKRAIEEGDESVLPDVMAIEEAQTKVVLAGNRKKGEFKK